MVTIRMNVYASDKRELLEDLEFIVEKFGLNAEIRKDDGEFKFNNIARTMVEDGVVTIYFDKFRMKLERKTIKFSIDVGTLSDGEREKAEVGLVYDNAKVEVWIDSDDVLVWVKDAPREE